MSRALDVWWDGRLVGQLTQPCAGGLRFVYAIEWLRDEEALALSASLPKKAQPFSRRECRPFFAGLLPEEGPRERVARALGVSSLNDFALLDRLGGDVAGALQLLPSGERPTDPRPEPSVEPLGEAELIHVLDTLQMRPLLAGEKGMRLSLAGAQSKLPVVVVGGAIALPAPGQPTTHILKPSVPEFAATTENETLVMHLGAAIGLAVASAEPRIVERRTFLLAERYDRTLGSGGDTRRIHQEDFCQALAVAPEIKYTSEGGPTLGDCFALLRGVAARPAIDVLRLLDAVIFNLIVGNADAHGKNFSILHDAAGPRLAPLYDLVMTAAYPGTVPHPCHAHRRPRQACRNGPPRVGRPLRGKRPWDSLWSGDASPRSQSPVIRRARDVADALMMPGLDEGALAGFARTVVKRAERCATSIGDRGE